MAIKRLTPAVPIKWLLILAGGLWGVVGCLLFFQAIFWLKNLTWPVVIPVVCAGSLMAYAAYRFAFKKIAITNIDRILSYSDESCIFAFQAWKSYLIIGIMILLGSTLRHSSLPRPYLSAIYLTIGGALFLASCQYYITVRSYKPKQ